MLCNSNILTCCRNPQFGGHYHSLRNTALSFSFIGFVLCLLVYLFISLRTIFRRKAEKLAYGCGKG